MRTLLVDNLDSYTFNLFQLIARVQRTEPVAVRHDGLELFSGIPQDFAAVRYHSLCG